MLIALSLMTAHAVFAFDVTTHAAMTIKAVQQSKIGSNPNASELLRRLGIVDSEKMIGQYYMHMGGQVTLTNRVIQMEVDTIENVSKGFGPVPPANSISGDRKSVG